MEVGIGKAFVLGAGLGTRLRPLTNHRPKPLVPVCNKPLITFAFDHLIAAGVREIFVNTHHCADRYDEVIVGGAYRGVPVRRRHERELLDTGGGIRNVADLADGDPLLVYNGDILTDLPLAPLIGRHLADGNDATLALRTSGGPLQAGFDPAAGLVTDIRGRLGRKSPMHCLFAGIYVVSSDMIRRIPAGRPVSVVDVWLEMLRDGAGRIGGVVLDEGRWWDVGTVEQYLAVHRWFAAGGVELDIPIAEEWPVWVAPGARVSPSAVLRGATCVGADAEVGADAGLSDCIVWPGGVVEAGARLSNSVVVDGARASGSSVGGVFGRSAFLPDTAVGQFIEDRARVLLPGLTAKRIPVTQLDKGGSDRSFFLVEPEAQDPMVALHYVGGQAGENARYVRVARFLESLGVHAPRIISHDVESGIVWMQHLGLDDLWSFRHAAPEEKLALYRAALDQAVILHSRGLDAMRRDGALDLHGGFDAALYRWERDYFVDRCLGGVFKLPDGTLDALRAEPALAAMADELATHPRVLVHRDFQSQNIMVPHGAAFLIDFQGMREGLPFYDVASLLMDPYTQLPEHEQAALLAYYLTEARRAGVPIPDDWRRCHDLCAVQRLMQALGAYGFLGLVKGRTSFLRHVPAAMRSLERVLASLPDLHAVHRVVRELL